MVNSLTKIEGFGVFLASLYFYNFSHGNWLIFSLLFLLPDISMLGYLKSNNAGKLTYSLVHNYLIVSLLLILGTLTNNIYILLGLILSTHIAFDRLLGFDLKYPSQFKSKESRK